MFVLFCKGLRSCNILVTKATASVGWLQLREFKIKAQARQMKRCYMDNLHSGWLCTVALSQSGKLMLMYHWANWQSAA